MFWLFRKYLKHLTVGETYEWVISYKLTSALGGQLPSRCCINLNNTAKWLEVAKIFSNTRIVCLKLTRLQGKTHRWIYLLICERFNALTVHSRGCCFAMSLHQQFYTCVSCFCMTVPWRAEPQFGFYCKPSLDAVFQFISPRAWVDPDNWQYLETTWFGVIRSTR